MWCETGPRGFVLKCLKKFFVSLGNMIVFPWVHLPDVVAYVSLLLPLFFNMFSQLKLSSFFWFSPKGIYFVFLGQTDPLWKAYQRVFHEFPGFSWKAQQLSYVMNLEPVTMRPGQELRFPAYHFKSWCLVNSHLNKTVQSSSVQLHRHVWLFAMPWIAACQVSLSITNSRRSPKLMCIKSVMPSSYLILCHPLLLLSLVPSSFRVFSNESTFHMRWPNYEFQPQHQPFQWTPRTGLL